METETIRTCQHCAIAKIRCQRSQPDGSCDRCRRLHKDCVFRPARRRLAVSTRDSEALASIEAKLDQLLSYHDAEQLGPANSDATTTDAQDVINAGIVTLKAAEYYVEVYRSHLTPHFPFVVLNPDISAQKLRQEKPLLFLAVLSAAAYGDLSVQRELAIHMRNMIAECIAGQDTMSFELLQALLVHLAWSHYHPRPRRYTQYLQLAISIVVDQRLDRPPRTVPWRTHVGSKLDAASDQLPPYSSRSTDVYRAVAGCYYLSSTISTLLQKLNTFQYTRYIENFCKSLSANPEYPTDKCLYTVVRLQYFMESVDPDPATGHSSSDHNLSNLSRMRVDLSSLKVSIPFPLNESYLVLMLFHTVELHAIQMSLFYSVPRPGASYSLEELDEGFQAVRSLFGFYLSLPLRKEMIFNNSEWLQLSLALTIAAKLVFAASDPLIVDRTKDMRDSLDLLGILRQIILRLDALESSATDTSSDPDVFHQYAQRVRRMQAWFEGRYAPAWKSAQPVALENANEHVEDGLSRLPGAEILLPDLQTLDGMPAYDAQLATLFPDDLLMEDGLGDWTMYRNALGY